MDKTLKQIFTATRGSTPLIVKDGTIPWITISDLTSRKIKKFTRLVKEEKNIKIYPEGSLLISFKMSVGRVGFLKRKSAINEAILAISPDKCTEDLSFLYFALPRLFKKAATKNGQGIPLLNQATIEKIKINLPSLKQQKAIAHVLSTQESVINDMEELIELYEKCLRYTSNELLSGRLRVKEVDGETVFYKNTEWKTEKVNGKDVEIPSDWGNSTIKSVSTLINGYAFKTSEMGKDKSDYPLIKIGNIQDNKVILCKDDNQIWVKNVKTNFIPLKNDLIVSLSGYPGKAGIFKLNQDVALNQRNCILRANGNLSQDYLNHFWLNYGISKISTLIKGAVISNISSEDVGKILIAFPNSSNEQTLIIDILNQQSSLMDEQKELLELEKKRFTWLLDNLLSGKYIIEDFDENEINDEEVEASTDVKESQEEVN